MPQGAGLYIEAAIVLGIALTLGVIVGTLKRRLPRNTMSGGVNSKRFGRRRFKRNKADRCPITVAWTDGDGKVRTVTARVLDISEHGIAVESPEPISTTTVHFNAAEHGVDGMAEVCYSEFRDGKYVVGMEFHIILNKRRLTRFIRPRL